MPESVTGFQLLEKPDNLLRILHKRSATSAVLPTKIREEPAKYASKGLYLEAPFDTMTAVATGHYPFVPGFILRDTFCSIDRMPKVRSPILMVHGLADVTIPPERGRALAASAPRGVKFIAIAGVGHDVVGMRDIEVEALFRPLAAEQIRLP